jgi:hypothetical protein
LNTLVAGGLVEKVDRGKYQITYDGLGVIGESFVTGGPPDRKKRANWERIITHCLPRHGTPFPLISLDKINWLNNLYPVISCP